MDNENVEKDGVKKVVEEDTTEDTQNAYDELTQEEAVERLRKAEALIVKHKKEPKPKEEEITKPTDSARIERVELMQEYPKEIVDSIIDLGGAEALKNPILKKTVDDMVIQHNAEKASSVQGGPNSSVQTKYSKEDLSNMSVEEMEKVLPHAD